MKNILLFLCLWGSGLTLRADSHIRINQLGYQPSAVKVAVFVSDRRRAEVRFELVDAALDSVVWTGPGESRGAYGPFRSGFRLDFSAFRQPGTYFLRVGKLRSPLFRIAADVYAGTADYLLRYLRQQRCGYNPYLNDSCHVDDGFVVYHPEKEGSHLDVTGGWHDASDYLQYTATSANAVFQLLFSYRENPSAFGDAFDAAGRPGPNGIPDVLDEAKWGMDWLLRMNPSPTEYYNQIADDRDHVGFRLPNLDFEVYDTNHAGRPVYCCTGRPQGLVRFRNRATGIASTAGKFASAFAIGAEVLADWFPDYAGQLPSRAVAAYRFGEAHPGVCQTAPGGAPYFYEEDNWVDDMELAAASLFRLTGTENYFQDALRYAEAEPVSPWMGADSARHYQWYPFFNAGHYQAAAGQGEKGASLRNHYRDGLERVLDRGRENPFLIGIPFIWCSNNLVTACLSQCRLYRQLGGDDRFLEMEAALRDWLFGCNPWGTSMVVGLPRDGDTPVDPHTAFTHLYGYTIDGGLVDGPVYGSIFGRLIGLTLFDADEYADFQSPLVVYHDDVGDYSTNEPTMDGTACLVHYFSSLEADGFREGDEPARFLYDETGAVFRSDTSRKEIFLVFTGDRYADGGDVIRRTLDRHHIPATFFLTGDFYRNPAHADLIRSLLADGHYLGPHSDRHLLYCTWSASKDLLVSRDSFTRDLLANYDAMLPFGIDPKEAVWFMPPFEWNNVEITNWTYALNRHLVNYSPGTLSHTDYTTPSMPNYRSSAEILASVREQEAKAGLNGFLLLLHIGTDPARTDKLYHHLDDLVGYLKGKGYAFRSVRDWKRMP
jgi:peptidoglycan/xylan/chitin deacetylase (PgdA/CDA1 family)